VDEVSLTVTISAVGVDSVKPEEDTLVTLPTDPPAAFVVRAPDLAAPFEPAAGAAGVDAAAVVDDEDEDDDVLPHAASPTAMTGSISPVAIRMRPLRASRRQCRTRPGCGSEVPSAKLVVLPRLFMLAPSNLFTGCMHRSRPRVALGARFLTLQDAAGGELRTSCASPVGRRTSTVQLATTAAPARARLWNHGPVPGIAQLIHSVRGQA
jgi:hypothetical protein